MIHMLTGLIFIVLGLGFYTHGIESELSKKFQVSPGQYVFVSDEKVKWSIAKLEGAKDEGGKDVYLMRILKENESSTEKPKEK